MKPEPFDLVVCGGGIAGAGIARDAAHRGLRVLLVEKNDFASGTSSKSSKLVHGGLRYLGQGEIRLVFEGTNERALQMRRAPHLVRPAPFLFPIYKRSKPGLRTMDIGLWIYDALAMFRTPKLHRTFRPKKVHQMEPALSTQELAGALEYYDCFTDDARLTLENVIDASRLGADVRNYTKFAGVEKDTKGRIRAVITVDALTGARATHQTRLLIVAGGPWTDEILGLAGAAGNRLIRPTKGIHIVVDHKKLPATRAITLFTRDERVVFTMPWGNRTAIGTTDTDFNGSPDEVYATRADVEYLCQACNEFFPNHLIQPSDVLSTWAGLRPLIAQGDGESPSDVSREHEVFVRDEGIIVIAGGKLTTYRRMAKEVVDKAVEWFLDQEGEPFAGRNIKRCRTKHRPLPGAQGLEPPGHLGVKGIAAKLEQVAKVPSGIADHLAHTYGVRAESVLLYAVQEPSLLEPLDPELPYIWAEVDHATEHEFARTLQDVLSRRIPLVLRARDQGLGPSRKVAERMGTKLGWDTARIDHEVRAYEQYVQAAHRFRDP